MRKLKFLIAPLMLIAVVFSFAACGDGTSANANGDWATLQEASLFGQGVQARVMSDGTIESAPIEAHGKTHELADYFTFKPEKVSITGAHHVVLESDAATYFSTDPADRNHDFASNSTFNAAFNCSADLNDDDYFVFVLAFNKAGADPGTYTHVTEVRIGVAKIGGQLKACAMNGVSASDSANLSFINTNGTNIAPLDSIRFNVTKTASDTLHAVLFVNATQLASDTLTTSADVVGARSLWLAKSTVDVTIWHLTH